MIRKVAVQLRDNSNCVPGDLIYPFEMTKTYSISEAQFTEAKNLIRANGGNIAGDNSFEIQGVEGSFERNDGSITINITRKPFLASWRRIEKTLDGFFEQ